MSRPSGEMWLLQAKNDMEAAGRLLDENDNSTYNQALAKYQQTVEKSIKGAVEALHEAGRVAGSPTMDHSLTREIQYLTLIQTRRTGNDVPSYIKKFLDHSYRTELKNLCELAPNRENRRNTEYPYQRSDLSWTIPADTDSFSLSEVTRFRKVAQKAISFLEAIVRLLRLGGAKV